jgi:hypothetical protein
MLVVYGSGRALYAGPLASASRSRLREDLHLCLRECRMLLLKEEFLPDDFWFVPEAVST